MILQKSHVVGILLAILSVFLVVSGTVIAASPQADIKANGSDGPVTLKSGEQLSVTAQLTPNDMAGLTADWWAGLQQGSTWSYYGASDNAWHSVGSDVSQMKSSYQGSLFTLAPYTIYTTRSLAAGSYTFYFGIDTVMNGVLDASTYYDSVSVEVADSGSGCSGLTFTKGSTTSISTGAIFPGIVYDGTKIVISYAKSGDLYVAPYNTDFTKISGETKITSRKDVTDHKHIFVGGYHYITYSTQGDADLYLMKLDSDLTQVGSTQTVTAGSGTTRTNDMLLAYDGTYVVTGEFRPQDRNNNETSGHLVKRHDTSLNYVSPDFVVNDYSHLNTASMAGIKGYMYIVAPSTPVFGSSVQTMRNLLLMRYTTAWEPVDTSAVTLVDGSTLTHKVNGDGIWMSTGLAYYESSDCLLVGHTFTDGSKGGDSGNIYFRAFDGTSFKERYSEVMVGTGSANRAHFLLIDGTLYVVYDDAGPEVLALKYTITGTATIN